MAVNPFLMQPIAATRAKSDGTTALADGNFQRGCAVAKTAKGIYTLTLQRNVDSTECVCLADCITAGNICTVEQTSDSVKTVHITDAAAADIDDGFHALVLRVGGGSGR